MAIRYTSEEIANCIYQLRDLIRDRESFLGDDEDYNDPFRKDIHYLGMAINILNYWKNNPDFLYSVRVPTSPPFMARTNDPAVIERINRLFIEIGGWSNVQFLLENLRLIDGSDENESE